MHLNDPEGMARVRMQDSERKFVRRALVREALATLPQEERPSFWQRFGRRPAKQAAQSPAPNFKGVPHSR